MVFILNCETKREPHTKSSWKSQEEFTSLSVSTKNWLQLLVTESELCHASVSPAVMSQLQWGGVWAAAPHVWKSLQIEERLQTVRHQSVLEWHWLHYVVFGAVALLICTFINHSRIVQGSNLKKSCCVSVSATAIGLRHGSIGWVANLKPERALAARWLFAVSLMLNVLYLHYIADLHVNDTSGTHAEDYTSHIQQERWQCCKGCWALGALPCCRQRLWNSCSRCVAAVLWALGWLLPWAVLHSFILSC